MWSPDGHRIAFGSGNPERERQDLWVVDADGSNPKLLIGGLKVGWYSSPGLAWSPDGDSLAFASGTEGVQILDLNVRRPRHVTFGSRPSWSPDGSRIAYFDPSDRLTLTDLGSQGTYRRRAQFLRFCRGRRARLGQVH